LNAIARFVAPRIINFLRKPSVRYRYLPKLTDVISYDRKEMMLHTCFEYASLGEVKGDYVEFGIWQGRSMIAAYHLSRRFRELSNMRFYGFDSFEGIPPLTKNKSEAHEFPPGSFRAGLEEVQHNLRNAKVDMGRVTLIPGWYAETLNDKTKQRLPLRAAAVVNVDCDVFESTVPVLDFIEPYLVDGSIVIFDDWYCFRNREELGQQRAFSEWLDRNRHIKATSYKQFGWDGKSFIINRLSSRQSPRVLSAATANPDSQVACSQSDLGKQLVMVAHGLGLL
jgi:O-methyltransferase